VRVIRVRMGVRRVRIRAGVRLGVRVGVRVRVVRVSVDGRKPVAAVHVAHKIVGW
jgi:hypothetical protein